MLISVVIPCFNEIEVIAHSHARLSRTFEALREFDAEFICVDDGSTDGTIDVLRRLAREDSRVKFIRLARNFGHQMAVSAGLARASGDAVVIIDADLQDPPEVILEMVELWRNGYKVVYGRRTHRAGETSIKRATAKAFYRVLNLLSDVEIPADVGDFRLMDRQVVDALLKMPERDRFLRGMISWLGFSQTAVPYARHSRPAGKSKYPFVKMTRFALDAILSFSYAPLRLTTWLGFLSIIGAGIGIVYAILVRLSTDEWVRGWASIFTAVLFLGGVQLVTLGIVGEYIGRIYTEVKRRPLYLIEETNFDAVPSSGTRTSS